MNRENKFELSEATGRAKKRKLALIAGSSYLVIFFAAIMGVAVFSLVVSLCSTSEQEILRQADIFNIIWLIGLFFFGIHLMLLGRILGRPGFIRIFLFLAGIMYIVDTGAHFLLPEYDNYASVFLAMVAIPSIFGEMSLSVWLLIKGGKNK